tara:strand:+ start:114 stop:326 length:213 start_codon:yes stop_codon:yes gene_type:complete
MAILHQHQYDYCDYNVFIDVGHALTQVQVYHNDDDDFSYRERFIGYDVDDIKGIIEARIDDDDDAFKILT